MTEDLEELRFNTCISAMMEFINGAYKWQEVPRLVMEPFVLLLSPFAPHLAEELWQASLKPSESLISLPAVPWDPEVMSAASGDPLKPSEETLQAPELGADGTTFLAFL